MINQIQEGFADIDRGRRHGLHPQRHRRSVGGGRAGGDPARSPAHARGGRALRRHRREDDDVRRVRVALAGQDGLLRISCRSAKPSAASASRTSRSFHRAEDQVEIGEIDPRGKALAARGHRGGRRGRRAGEESAPRARRPDDRWTTSRSSAQACPGRRIPSRTATHRRGVVPSCPADPRQLLTEQMPGLRSATVGAWVGVNSRDESGHFGSTHSAPAVQGRDAGPRWTPGVRRRRRVRPTPRPAGSRARARRRPPDGGRRHRGHGDLGAARRRRNRGPSAA